MKPFSKRDKNEVFITTMMTDIIKFLYNNGKSAIYIGGNMHELYLEMIGSPTQLTSSGQRSHYFDTSYYTKNDTSNIYTVIVVISIL